MPRARSFGLAALVAASVVVGVACGEGNPGQDPPSNAFLFPSGVLLDPRVSDAPTGDCDIDDDCASGELCGAGGQCRATARWLLVTNANSDLRYNAAWMTPVDLDAFWSAAFSDPTAVGDPSAGVSTAAPCRRVAGQPQTVECTESPFIANEATIQFGNFPGPTAAWDRDPGDDEAMLLVPVRGEPSITYVELSGGLDGDALRLECDQGSDSDGGRRCGDDHRLRFARNDPDADRIAREPFRVHVSPQPELPLAYVTHQGDPDMSLIALEGLEVGGDGRPAIVHQSNVLVVNGAISGGFGIAQRPCDVASDNAPTSTKDCTQPLVYASLRWANPIGLQLFTAVDREPIANSDQVCVAPDDLDQPGAVLCESRVEPIARVAINGLSTVGVIPSVSNPYLADVAFSSSGNELYVLQSNPGGVIRVDTSLGEDGEPVNLSAGTVEVCAKPTSMTIYADGPIEYGLVTCYRSAEMFIVDLASLTVAGLVRAGIGPDQVEVDYAREVVYVANTLDASVSVIDMAGDSPARFTEIGRIGLSEPYTQ